MKDIYTNSNVISEFTYTNDVLTEIKQTFGSPTNPARIDINTFTYSNNTVKAVNDNPLKFEKNMSLDNQGLLLNSYNYRSMSNENYNEYYTYDNNKNMISFSLDNKSKLDYNFDNSNGIFKNVKMPQWAVFYSLANCVHSGLSLSIYNNLIDISGAGNNVNKFQYTYNNDNYPITVDSDYIGLVGNITYSK